MTKKNLYQDGKLLISVKIQLINVVIDAATAGLYISSKALKSFVTRNVLAHDI